MNSYFTFDNLDQYFATESNTNMISPNPFDDEILASPLPARQISPFPKYTLTPKPTQKEENPLPKIQKPQASTKISKTKTQAAPKKAEKPEKTDQSKRRSFKRNPWTAKEDAQVLELVRQHGTRWAIVSSFMKNRTGKQVRDRFVNYLAANINREEWTDQEDNLLIALYNELGNKWSLIATRINGRTENQVKSRFYTYLKKKIQINSEIEHSSHSDRYETLGLDENESCSMPQLENVTSDDMRSFSGFSVEDSEKSEEKKARLFSLQMLLAQTVTEIQCLQMRLDLEGEETE